MIMASTRTDSNLCCWTHCQTNTPRSYPAAGVRSRRTAGRAAQPPSGTQFPWNPAGTRCGSSITACASPSRSSALRMCSAEDPVSAECTSVHQPAVGLAGVVGARDEDGLTQRGARPKERLELVPRSRSWRISTDSVPTIPSDSATATA